jgi:hypothetical protein
VERVPGQRVERVPGRVQGRLVEAAWR